MYETSDTLAQGGTLAHSMLETGGYPTIGYDATAAFLQGKIKPFVEKVEGK